MGSYEILLSLCVGLAKTPQQTKIRDGEMQWTKKVNESFWSLLKNCCCKAISACSSISGWSHWLIALHKKDPSANPSMKKIVSSPWGREVTGGCPSYVFDCSSQRKVEKRGAVRGWKRELTELSSSLARPLLENYDPPASSDAKQLNLGELLLSLGYSEMHVVTCTAGSNRDELGCKC